MSRPSLVLFFALLLTVPLAGCGSSASQDEQAASQDEQAASQDEQAASDSASDAASFQQRFTAPIEQAHADSLWKQKGALAADLSVSFGGQTRFDGRMVMAPDAAHTRLEVGGDTVAVFDGQQAWVAPDTTAMPNAHFTLLTYPYFAAVPHKLRDPGTHLADRDSMMMHGTPMPAARLTFAEGTGASPDDWYLLYRDPQTGRLAAMGYVVTYGGTTAEEANPHAIVYGGYQNVDGVPVPTEWTFRRWSEEQGPHGGPIGRVTLRNPHFIQPSDSTFARPPGAQPAPMLAAGN